MTVAQGTPSKFEYLLNAVERAAMQLMPSQHGYAGHRAKVIDYVTKLERENAALAAQVVELEELHRMQLVAISVLSYANVADSTRLPEDSPYRTVAYDDVLKAIGREIEWRDRAEAAAAQVVALTEKFEATDVIVVAAKQAHANAQFRAEALAAQVVELQKDAERYRHLREDPDRLYNDNALHWSAEQMDAAIDAEIAADSTVTRASVP